MNSPLSWIGGKSRLTKEIIKRIPEHRCYVEPFAGAAWVLFRKEESRAEVLNDINRELINLYRVIQNHLEEFVRQFKWILVSREEFERMGRARPDTLTDIQRAVRFYYRQKLTFGGKVAGRTFGYSATAKPRLNLLRIEEDLSAAHLRLARVLIESLPYTDLIPRYDRPETFFYIDPPYFGCEDFYGKGVFSREDFARLAELLGGIKGRFLLSLNKAPETLEIFNSFEIEDVVTRYSCSRDADVRVTEILVRNY